MAIARAFVLFFFVSLAFATNTVNDEGDSCGDGDVSCHNHAKPNKGAAMFQASISMQTQPVNKLASLVKDKSNKSLLRSVFEQVVKRFDPSNATATTTQSLTSFVGYFMFTFAAALAYRKCKSDKSGVENYLCSTTDLESPRFAYGLLCPQRCFTGDRMMFVLSFCCIGIRWADTMEKSRMAGFWVAWFAFTVCAGLGHYSGGFTTVILMCLVVYSRQVLRKTYHMEHGSMKTCLTDIAVWWFCFPFAAVQEARQVEYVRLVKDMKTE